METVAEVENEIKKAEPKVDMIFLEAASLADSDVKQVNPEHMA